MGGDQLRRHRQQDRPGQREQRGDVEAHIEFVVPQGSNSGIYFQGRYEIQVFDSFGVKKSKYSDCGGIYQRWANGKGFEGHAP
ncbi:MAG: DUF1080 domain-containing protein, partial [Chloroflexi bacterium]|nr:DUF1080 domain-containing protein [Chloroflexota bacterium]